MRKIQLIKMMFSVVILLVCPNSLYAQESKSISISVNDTDKNWVFAKTFDIAGELKVAGVNYFNSLGKATQSHALDMKTNKIWVSETRYDFKGRSAFQTLRAPLSGTPLNFNYESNFIRKSNNSALTIADLELNPELPPTIGTASGTLGWYYSNNNTSEYYQDNTNRPYSRTVYDELNPGNVRMTAGGKIIDLNNDGDTNDSEDGFPQGYSYTMPAAQELYYAYGQDYFDGPVSSNGKEVIAKIFKSVSIDPQGNEVVIFKDAQKGVLAIAQSGSFSYDVQSNIQLTEVLCVIGKQGFVDVHIPRGVNNFELLGEASGYTIYNLRTGEQITSSQMTGGSVYRLHHSASSNGKTYITISGEINHDTGAKGIRYNVNYHDYALNYYDQAGRMIKTVQPLGFDPAAYDLATRVPNHDLITHYDYNAIGELQSVSSPDEGASYFKYRNDGQIRFSQNSEQAAANEYTYIEYDHLGRPIESGVLQSDDFNTANPDGPLVFAARIERLFTQYDTVDVTELSGLGLPLDYLNPQFLSGNVSRTKNDQTTTYYNYDVYGRVVWVVQKITGLGVKTIDYEYDDITGQISRVVYQKTNPNEIFIHRYNYDSIDNSLVKVETSTDGLTYITHADYDYYETGALKRTNLAGGLQGIDYVYTIGGQLKQINHPSLKASKDPGTDTNDLFGMALDYNKSDYTRAATHVESAFYGKDLFNGNIKGMRWNNGHQPLPDRENAYGYYYNNKNWLKNANYGEYRTPPPGTGDIPPHIISTDVVEPSETLDLVASCSIRLKPGFHAKNGSNFTAQIFGFTENRNRDYNVEGITYDPNGNIQTLSRNKNTVADNNAMDDLDYKYKIDKPNQLLRVDDTVTIATNADDIKDQNGSNYQYNSIGQLVSNAQDNLEYQYNTTGLVTQVLKDGAPLVKFYYSDKNHRIKKESFYPSGTISTYYVRDASGTPMAIYTQQGTNTTLEEHTIYGTSRLGIYKRPSETSQYQLTDHLGNVRGVILKNNSGAAAITAATDYYPFGMPMPERNLEGDYRYAYQGQEKDPETDMEAFELRLWDSRIGRWLTTDPAGQYESPYLGMGNDPINGIDPDGGFRTRFGAWLFRTIKGTGGELFENDYGDWGIDVSDGSYEGGINTITGSKWEERNLFGNSGGYFTQWNGLQPELVFFASPEPEHQNGSFTAYSGQKTLKSERVIFSGNSFDEVDDLALRMVKNAAIGKTAGNITKVFGGKETAAAILGAYLGDLSSDITVINSIEGVMYTKINYYGVERNALIGDTKITNMIDVGNGIRGTYDINTGPQRSFKGLYQHNTVLFNGKVVGTTRQKAPTYYD